MSETTREEGIRSEMVHTESVFVGFLQFLIKNYKDPLIQHAKVGEALLTSSEIEIVFKNVDELLGLSKKLLENLLKKNVDICQIFQRLDDQISKIYIPILRNSSQATSIALQAMEKRPAFAKFCQKREFTLNTLLVQPAQRITQYKTFLTALLKLSEEQPATEASKQQSSILQSSIKNLDHIARQSLRSLRWSAAAESWNKLERFGTQLPFNPNRTLILEGYLSKVNRKGSREEKQVWLFSDALAYGRVPFRIRRQNSKAKGLGTTSKKSPRSPTEQSGPVKLSQIFTFPSVEACKGSANSIRVLTPRKSPVFHAESALEQAQWVDEINKAVRAFQPDRGSGMAVFAPVWTENTSECMVCGGKFGLRGRHHCRHCGACVCQSCSSKKILLPHISNKKPSRVCDNCYNYVTVARLSDKQDKAVSNPYRITSLGLQANCLVTDLVGSVLRNSTDKETLAKKAFTPVDEDEDEDVDVGADIESGAAVASEGVGLDEGDDIPIEPIEKENGDHSELTSAWERYRQVDEHIIALQTQLKVYLQDRTDLDHLCRKLLQTEDMDTPLEQLMSLTDSETQLPPPFDDTSDM